MMKDIYELHATAFARVSAYVVTRDGEKVATVAFKYPSDGAGRLYVYGQWLGLPMMRACATGYGYDKATAACVFLGQKLDIGAADARAAEYGVTLADARPWHVFYRDFVAALRTNDGHDWHRNLEKAGFCVMRAV
jgi:hypothetical protein